MVLRILLKIEFIKISLKFMGSRFYGFLYYGVAQLEVPMKKGGNPKIPWKIGQPK